jgi:hypothetical protein
LERVAAARGAALAIRHDDPGAAVRATPTGLTLLIRGVAAGTFTWLACPTVAALADAVAAHGGGWSAAALLPFAQWPSADLQPLRVPRPAAGAGAEFRVYDQTLDVELDADAGVLRGRFPPGADNIRIEYTAGFDPLPEALQQAAAALAAQWHLEAQRDPTLAGLVLNGNESYRRAPDAWPALVRRLVEPYRAGA